MRVLLTRHGEMDIYDPAKSLQAHGISTLGEVQAILLGERLADLADDLAIVSGPSDRHVETADRISNTIESIRGDAVEVTVDDGLDDARWGRDALENAGQRSLSQRGWAEALVEDDLPVDEPFPEVRDRILDAWQRLSGEDGESVLVVTSFIAVSVILAEILSLSLNPPQFHVNNASLTEILLTEDTRIVCQMNSTGHLSSGLETTNWSGY